MSDMDMSYAKGWRPNDGDTLIGKVTDLAVGRSNFGGAYPIVTVQPDDDGYLPVAVHCFHAALKNRVVELRPEVGERIGFKYLGKRQHKTDPTLTVADYVVKIDGRSASNVWALFPQPSTTDIPATAADFQTAAPLTDDDIPF